MCWPSLTERIRTVIYSDYSNKNLEVCYLLFRYILELFKNWASI